MQHLRRAQLLPFAELRLYHAQVLRLRHFPFFTGRFWRKCPAEARVCHAEQRLSSGAILYDSRQLLLAGEDFVQRAGSQVRVTVLLDVCLVAAVKRTDVGLQRLLEAFAMPVPISGQQLGQAEVRALRRLLQESFAAVGVGGGEAVFKHVVLTGPHCHPVDGAPLRHGQALDLVFLVRL